MRKAIIIISIVFAMLSCRNEAFVFQEGDLLFCISDDNEMSEAIEAATFRQNDPTSISFDHVAMVAVDSSGSAYIIEASPSAGVHCMDLKAFLETHTVVVKRLHADFPAKDAVERALIHLGEDYDWSYLPDNGKMYCSELIYECYLNTDGTHIFSAAPMTFRDENGNLPKFWQDLFDGRGEEVPEGVSGTNPNDMARDPKLQIVRQR